MLILLVILNDCCTIFSLPITKVLSVEITFGDQYSLRYVRSIARKWLLIGDSDSFWNIFLNIVHKKKTEYCRFVNWNAAMTNEINKNHHAVCHRIFICVQVIYILRFTLAQYITLTQRYPFWALAFFKIQYRKCSRTQTKIAVKIKWQLSTAAGQPLAMHNSGFNLNGW